MKSKQKFWENFDDACQTKREHPFQNVLIPWSHVEKPSLCDPVSPPLAPNGGFPPQYFCFDVKSSQTSKTFPPHFADSFPLVVQRRYRCGDRRITDTGHLFRNDEVYHCRHLLQMTGSRNKQADGIHYESYEKYTYNYWIIIEVSLCEPIMINSE